MEVAASWRMDHRRVTIPEPVAESVSVAAPARLHMGFLDPGGGTGRRFGSLGLTLQEPCTRVTVWPAAAVSAAGPSAARAAACARGMLPALGLPGGVHVEVGDAIPEHAGLGSGTQLALAVGTAIARLFGRECGVRDTAALLERGARSGIGIGAFEQGGFLVDGGRGPDTLVPPIISRLAFPPHWRLLLIFDRSRKGVHGGEEKAAFQSLPPFPAEESARLCRLTLMQALPALAEADSAAFGHAITEIQRVVGDHFAAAQGGRFASPAVAVVLAWLQAEGVAGVGQSSWGPTGFAVIGNEVEARRLLHAARARWNEGPLRFMVCAARNQGGEMLVGGCPALEQGSGRGSD